MTELDLDQIADDLGEGPVKFVDAGPSEPAQVPERWRGIAESTDPEARRAAALSLWNREFLDMVPKFAQALSENLTDVRVCVLRGDWVLVYVARATDQRVLLWVGWDPDTFGETRPPFWDAIPKPPQDFLTTVHAGFTAPDGESYGIIQPARMTTYAEWAGFDDPAEDWDQAGEISSTRFMFVTKDSGLLDFCVSPDLPPGKVALIYEGDIDPREDFGPALDNLMTSRFEPE
jgi:hypothetical protein